MPKYYYIKMKKGIIVKREKKQEVAIEKQAKITEIKPGIYQFYSEKPGSHVYLLRGSDKNILIDTGMTSNFKTLSKYLREIGLRVQDVHFVILTH